MSDLNVEGRHPIILPGKHHVSSLLIQHYHTSVHHQGRHITEGAIRAAGLWITGCKRLVSALCHKCVSCRKLRAKASQQIMADLSSKGLTPAPPFTLVGVDAFGPFNIVTRRTRGGAANSKRCARVFTGMVTRAIHIEVMEDMRASSFINDLSTIYSPQGSSEAIRSDRGNNFVGASKELGMKAINVEDGPVNNFLTKRNVEWVLNPPHSSHMGGSWERMIGITRRILDSMLTGVPGNTLTHEVLVTFLAEVCAIINSGPLVTVSNDPDCPFILSSNTLLTQKLDQIVEDFSDFDIRDMYTKQWKRVQVLAETFWNRWRREYLCTLQGRRKWREVQATINDGDIVLLKDKSAHQNDWPMGIVVNALPADDRHVRKCEVRLNRGDTSVVYTRPISEVVLLIPKT